MAVDDIYSWKLFDLCDVKCRIYGMLARRIHVKFDVAVKHGADFAAVWRFKGIDSGSVGFSHLSSCVDLVVHHDHYALACGFFVHSYVYGVKDI